jgi:hypothetical protein
MFLQQVLSNDQSCRNAVINTRMQKNTHDENISSNTAAYCKARLRLDENTIRTAAENLGKSIHNGAAKSWMWCGRSVKLVDGTTISMPDTEMNQAQYPQISAQKPGLGFPIARVLAIISLATGAIMNLAIGTFRTSEYALLHSLLSTLEAGDIVLADLYFDSYFEFTYLIERKIDAVVRMRATRKLYASKTNGVVKVSKPEHRPEWMTQQEFEQLPAHLTLRIVWKNKLAVLTTLLDGTKYPDDKIISLYRERWNVEVDLRSIKVVMQMDILRCKTPEMVRKELWTHMLAYNLIRSIMVLVAEQYNVPPRSISFKSTVQACNALSLFVSTLPFSLITKRLLYETIAQNKVGDRPFRREPRAIKRRPKNHDLLMIPRAIAKEKLNRVGLS